MEVEIDLSSAPNVCIAGLIQMFDALPDAIRDLMHTRDAAKVASSSFFENRDMIAIFAQHDPVTASTMQAHVNLHDSLDSGLNELCNKMKSIISMIEPEARQASAPAAPAPAAAPQPIVRRFRSPESTKKKLLENFCTALNMRLKNSVKVNAQRVFAEAALRLSSTGRKVLPANVADHQIVRADWDAIHVVEYGVDGKRGAVNALPEIHDVVMSFANSYGLGDTVQVIDGVHKITVNDQWREKAGGLLHSHIMEVERASREFSFDRHASVLRALVQGSRMYQLHKSAVVDICAEYGIIMDPWNTSYLSRAVTQRVYLLDGFVAMGEIERPGIVVHREKTYRHNYNGETETDDDDEHDPETETPWEDTDPNDMY